MDMRRGCRYWEQEGRPSVVGNLRINDLEWHVVSVVCGDDAGLTMLLDGRGSTMERSGMGCSS